MGGVRDKTKTSVRMKEDKPSSATTEAATPTPATASSDVALIHGVSADGAVQIIRRRGDRLEAGALTPLREGAPIQGEVVSLRPRESCPLLCDVDVHYAPASPKSESQAAPQSNAAAKPTRPALRRKGPAQVATDTYRDNWDSIWSRKKKPDALN
jgi:hypothetical protein